MIENADDRYQPELTSFNNILRLLIPVLLLTYMTWCSQEHEFFWDQIVQVSLPANWFFQHGLSQFWQPGSSDTGHFPLIGYYLASIWTILGRTLFVSHWAFFPFTVGIVYQAIQLIKYCIPERRYQTLSLWVLLTNPVLMTQTSFASPELPLVFFFLWSANLISRKHSESSLCIATLFLGLLSYRGMLALFALMGYQVWLEKSDRTGSSKKASMIRLWPFFPALLVFSGYSLLHFLKTGWFFHNSVSGNWEQSGQIAGITTMIKNCGITIWRWIDFGMVSTWLAGLFCLFSINLKGMLRQDRSFKNLAGLFLITTAVMIAATIPTQNSIAHRYFLPGMCLLTAVVSYLITRLKHNQAVKTGIFVLLVCSNGAGHFLVYPEGVAMGWDATLGHWPYFNLKKEMVNHIREKNIPFHCISTVFPAIGPFDAKDLSGNSDGFVSGQMGQSAYILYSNIMNDNSDSEIATLQSKWEVIKYLKSGNVTMILYKNPNPLHQSCEN